MVQICIFDNQMFMTALSIKTDEAVDVDDQLVTYFLFLNNFTAAAL